MPPTLPFDLIFGVAISHGMEWLKDTPLLPWLQRVGQPRLKAFLASAFSFCAALGLAFSYDAGTGTLIITGLTLDQVGQAGMSWLTTWATAQSWYKGVTERQKAASRLAIMPGTGMSEAEVREHAQPPVAELLAKVATELRTDARTSVEREAA